MRLGLSKIRYIIGQNKKSYNMYNIISSKNIFKTTTYTQSCAKTGGTVFHRNGV